MPEIHLILIAHGSKDPRWRKPFESLYEKLKASTESKNVSLCYMEFANPKLIDVIDNGYKSGLKKIKILPLFMAGGGHVDMDIPEQVKEAKEKYPGIEIEILKPIGEHPEIVNCMIKVSKGLISYNLT